MTLDNRYVASSDATRPPPVRRNLPGMPTPLRSLFYGFANDIGIEGFLRNINVQVSTIK